MLRAFQNSFQCLPNWPGDWVEYSDDGGKRPVGGSGQTGLNRHVVYEIVIYGLYSLLHHDGRGLIVWNCLFKRVNTMWIEEVRSGWSVQKGSLLYCSFNCTSQSLSEKDCQISKWCQTFKLQRFSTILSSNESPVNTLLHHIHDMATFVHHVHDIQDPHFQRFPTVRFWTFWLKNFQEMVYSGRAKSWVWGNDI